MKGLGSPMILAVIASVEDCLSLDFLFMRKKETLILFEQMPFLVYISNRRQFLTGALVSVSGMHVLLLPLAWLIPAYPSEAGLRRPSFGQSSLNPGCAE